LEGVVMTVLVVGLDIPVGESELECVVMTVVVVVL